MMASVEYPFLREVPIEALKEHLQRCIPQLADPAVAVLDRHGIYNVLFSLHGFDVMQSADIRRLVLLSMPDDTLRALGGRLGIDGSDKVFDLAVRLANLQWRSGAPIVAVLAGQLGIGDEFLPGTAEREATSEVVEPFAPLPPLFPYQGEVIAEIASFLGEEGEKACLVQLPTGAGKTRVAMEGLGRFLLEDGERRRDRTIVWMAHSEELCDQAADAFVRVWGATGAFGMRLTRLWGSYQPSPTHMRGSFLVGGYQKLIALAARSGVEFERLLRAIDVIVVDEAHKALAPTVREFLTRVQQSQPKLIGLTATPGRGQHDTFENRRLAALFDRRLLTAHSLGEDPVGRLREIGVLSQVQRRTIETDVRLPGASGFSDLDDIPSKVLTKLAGNSGRNEMIVDAVVEQVSALHPTLVFSCSVDHARQLAVSAAGRGVRSAFLDCSMSRERRRKVISAFRSGSVEALFNFGVLSTGFDAPNISCVVIARPTTSIVLYSQMVGRGLRGPAVGGTGDFLLIDVKDNLENFGGIEDVYGHFEPYWRPPDRRDSNS